MLIVLRPNLEHSLHHLQILTEPFNQICGRFYFYFIASPVGFIKFAFKLKAIYQCGLTLNWNITTVRIVSKIFYLVFPDVFNKYATTGVFYDKVYLLSYKGFRELSPQYPYLLWNIPSTINQRWGEEELFNSWIYKFFTGKSRYFTPLTRKCTEDTTRTLFNKDKGG